MNAKDSATKLGPATSWVPRYHDDDTDTDAKIRQRRKVEQLIEARKRGYPRQLQAILGCGGATAAVAIAVWVLLLTNTSRPRPGHIALSILLGVAVVLTAIGWLIIDAAIQLHRGQDAISEQRHQDTVQACAQMCADTIQLAEARHAKLVRLVEDRHAEMVGRIEHLCELVEGDRAAKAVIVGATNAMNRLDGRASLASVPTSQG